jgi:rubrerythrin
LLIGKPTTKECLEKAIEGETYEFTTMYPQFYNNAVSERNAQASDEFLEQMNESAEHAKEFKKVLETAEKRFAALKKVEEFHAKAYKQVLETL